MATSPQSTPAAELQRRESPRITLARAAAGAALSHPAVTRLDSGASGLHATVAGTERLGGVTSVADGDGYAVALFLVVMPIDLHALAQEVEGAVREAATAHGLDTKLTAVHITFTDLTLPDESTRT
jgi:hypothetical protein